MKGLIVLVALVSPAFAQQSPGPVSAFEEQAKTMIEIGKLQQNVGKLQEELGQTRIQALGILKAWDADSDDTQDEGQQ